jgi:hypothetical protein
VRRIGGPLDTPRSPRIRTCVDAPRRPRRAPGRPARASEAREWQSAASSRQTLRRHRRT